MACPAEILTIWETIKEKIKQDSLTESFELWFSSLTPVDFDMNASELIFETDSLFKQKLLTEKFGDMLVDRFSKHLGFAPKISFRVAEAKKEAEQPKTEEFSLQKVNKEEQNDSAENNFNNTSKYTFENFIEGASNRFARAACWKVAHNPSREWNPLFIYGPSGVGKTHLMCAVIHEIKKQNPNARVLYTKGDDFLNYMIDCLSHQAMSTFRERYRNCDVLLVDDIQFISGKVSTQEEFFHTFQALFDEGKQIILASDRPPKDINPLEERLRSRFEQGLLADINPPDMELRVAIIKKKAEDVGIDVPDEVLTYLAENLRSNIRQIEGSIKKLAAKSLVDGRRISLELAKDCISDLLGDEEPLSVTIDKIFAAIYKNYAVTKEEVTGNKRNKEIANARHIAIYLIREITEMSYPNIGKIFGRDHATVMSSISVVQKKISADPSFNIDITAMKKDISGN